MTTIIIKPKTEEEKELLTKMLRKMNIDASIVEDSSPNYETQKAIKDVENKKGNEVKDAKDLFDQLGI